MIQTQDDPQVDERAWQAWIRKNDAQDKARFTRRVRVIGLVSLLLTLGALFWKFAM